MVDKPTLTYFNVSGWGIVPRLLLELADQDYHYEGISFRGGPGAPFDEIKAKYGDAITFGQVPLYSEPGLYFLFPLFFLLFLMFIFHNFLTHFKQIKKNLFNINKRRCKYCSKFEYCSLSGS
jgi:hypothetical protein